jgi:hypothetical protein
VARYEQNNSAVTYTGTWDPNSGGFNSGASATLAMDAGDQAVFAFTGTAVNWIGYRDQWSGIAQVYLDGVLKGTIDTYSATALAQTTVYSITGLNNASHTLSLVVSGTRSASSQGDWVWVDAFDVTVPATTNSSTATAASSPVVAPATSTPIRVEQNGSAVTYTRGTWFPKSYAWASGGSIAMAADANARATVTFTGTAVKWIGYRDQWSGNARVYVDGILMTTVDTYASPAQTQATLYSATGLARGVHSLAIEVAATHDAGSGGNWVWVDAFDVTP